MLGDLGLWDVGLSGCGVLRIWASGQCYTFGFKLQVACLRVREWDIGYGKLNDLRLMALP